MASPIQIVLNPDNFQEAREKGGGGGHKDFFAHRDKEFAAHKASLLQQIETISGELAAQTTGSVGYAKVILRREAWAKSHRPMTALFRPDRTRLVGGADLGVMIVEARPRSLAEVAKQIEEAETETILRFDETKNKDVPHPSARKSEVGAIDRIELFGASDKRNFSVEEAVAWLSNPMTGGSYQVELFTPPAPRADWDRLDEANRKLLETFVAGFSTLGQGVSVARMSSGSGSQPLLSVRLDETTTPVLRMNDTPSNERKRALAPFAHDIESHIRLLEFLDNHPLVRRIELPGIIVRANAATENRTRPSAATINARALRRSYPKLGVVDGGISPALDEWIIDRWTVLADEDSNHAHGTFIGGLATIGASLNGPEICSEADGAELVDIAIFPSPEKAGAFASYYPDGVPQFFDEMEAAVADAHARHGVRVFNMSLNILQPAATDRYSAHAVRLDGIAEANNAVIFVSAGNTQPQDLRPEWPADASRALADLALARNDGLLTPAESARNVTIAALNPTGHDGCVPYAPTRYSRRGPGLRGSMKPDLAHVGGAGTQHTTLGHGLFSILPDGAIVDGCGTSYAAPIAAKTAAVIEHLIEGEVSRETIIGMLVHHARLPEPLRDKTLSPVARHLGGFGMPPSAEKILETGDHSITLVFASRIKPGEQINFGFSWPASLVEAGGKCRGAAKLTLVSTPPLDARFGAEYVRVNINAVLQQEQAPDKWKGRIEPVYLPDKRDRHAIEAELIEHDLKWSPVKVHAKNFPKGVGPSSNWRLFVEYLTRAGEEMPEEGVPFTAVLTISDPTGDKPVFNEMRQNLQAIGAQITDIRTAARITPRV